MRTIPAVVLAYRRNFNDARPLYSTMVALSALLRRAVLAWAPLAVTIIMLCGLVYAVAEQELRSNADDPQIQMAEDTAARLNAGAPVATVAQSEPVDLSRSVAPYLIVFDDHGQPLASTAALAGKTPTLPPGVFDSVRTRGEDRLTWQPAPGVRSAIVVTRYRQGFVLAGRSLRLVEERETNVEGAIALLGLLTLGISALACLATAWLHHNWAREPGPNTNPR